MPLQQTSGNVTSDAYGGGVAVEPVYIEQIFSTYLYTGNGSTQTITNGIDLSTKGGLTWLKRRDAVRNHGLFDTVRGATKLLYSDLTNAEYTDAYSLTSFNSNGFSLGLDGGGNANGGTYASWTFRKQPKFFDVVTFTSNSSGGCTFNHSLGASPGFVTIKRTDSTSNWLTYHRSVGNDAVIYLNTTAASASVPGCFTPSSTQFTVQDGVLANSATYVAYLFAHNAGGFGLTGTDNVISCGSYTGNGTTVGPDVNLGYEPQFLMVKNASAVGSWFMWDSMRGITADGSVQNLTANSANAENTSTSAMSINATGFSPRSAVFSGSGSTYIYIAIRRGPMKVPTDATKVFAPASVPVTSSPTTITSGFPVDLAINTAKASGYSRYFIDRLRGSNKYLTSDTTTAEGTGAYWGLDSNTTFIDNNIGTPQTSVDWMFRRAPSFFDEVCYTGTSATQNISHNLGVVPELMIIKDRTSAQGWPVYNSTQGNTKILLLNSSGNGFTSSTYWNSTTPTSSVFTVGTNALTNSSGSNFVAYLFATCAGVSKVGSYTGNGSTQTINCGFTGGARFVLIKRTDSTGDWYVYDTARGMTTLTDPYLLLNSTAAESATLGSVTTVSTGFAVNASILAAINTNGASYIFLAIS